MRMYLCSCLSEHAWTRFSVWCTAQYMGRGTSVSEDTGVGPLSPSHAMCCPAVLLPFLERHWWWLLSNLCAVQMLFRGINAFSSWDPSEKSYVTKSQSQSELHIQPINCISSNLWCNPQPRPQLAHLFSLSQTPPFIFQICNFVYQYLLCYCFKYSQWHNGTFDSHFLLCLSGILEHELDVCLCDTSSDSVV